LLCTGSSLHAPDRVNGSVQQDTHKRHYIKSVALNNSVNVYITEATTLYLSMFCLIQFVFKCSADILQYV